MMKSYHIITLGCKVNSYESEAMGEILQEHGYLPSSKLDGNDLILINTCSVTHVGDAKSRQMIRRSISHNPSAICVVVGCYAQMASAEISAIDGVNIIIGTRNRENLWEYIEKYQAFQQPVIAIEPTRKEDKFDFLKVTSYSENTRAYLKIQDGCNNFCSYCIIPFARGSMRSRPKEEILLEAQQLVDNGFQEIVLTGIHTAGYGDDLVGYHFTDLLYDIVTKVQGIKRLRISSIEASQISDRLIALLKQYPVIVNHLHIPLQSGSKGVLKRMNRHYQTEEYLETIMKIRQEVPNIAITTDVIVGFPKETAEEFQETVDFIKKVQFSMLHVFPYSSRKGTPASKMSGQIDAQVKKERAAVLIQLSQQLHHDYANNFLGSIEEVLFETREDKTNTMVGYTTNYLKVHVVSKEDLHNTIHHVKLVSLKEDGTMIGELVNEPEKFVKNQFGYVTI